MPSRNTVRSFAQDQMYHIYNRGVDKRSIFLDDRDYAVFLSYLKYALTPKTEEVDVEVSLISEAQRFNLRRLDMCNRLDLLAFCLMPNHFHLMVYQYDAEAVTALMRSIATGYSMYFNKRYQRSGALFQGKYKASLINQDGYFLHISRYIHLNPIEVTDDYKKYEASSFKAYMGEVDIPWLKTDWVLGNFDSPNEYARFVADYTERRAELKEIDAQLAD